MSNQNNRALPKEPAKKTVITTTTSNIWSTTQTFALAAVCLVLGICGGWMLHESQRHSTPAVASAAGTAPGPNQDLPLSSGPNVEGPSPAQLDQAAESQAAPLLAQLKSDPENAGLLVKLGNIFYDSKQYSKAIEYYEHSLKSQPSNTSVRTDLGTSYWYSGNADAAIREFNKALTYEPTKADTLFNLGIVKWQGKKDAQGAVAAWQALLAANPNYENKDNVLKLIAQAQNH